MLVRLRTKVGMWRQETSEGAPLAELIATVEHDKSVRINKVSLKPDFSQEIQDQRAKPLREFGIKHGDILYVDAEGAVPGSGGAAGASASKNGGGLAGAGPRKIDAHGNLVKAENEVDPQGFRPGLQSLRTQKLHWTLTDMVEFDQRYTFEIKGEQKSFCASASLDADSCNRFQIYLQNFGFLQPRCAYLYGKFVDAEDIPGSVEHRAKHGSEDEKKAAAAATGATAGSSVSELKASGRRQIKVEDLEKMVKQDERPEKGVIVHAFYEPLQEASAEGVQLLEDPREEKVEAVAKALGLEKVGFLFSHPPGREGYTISTHEVSNAAEQALEATDGKMDSPFVVVKVTSESGNASFDAFSLTPQCLEMVAEDAILSMRDAPGHSAVNETFTVIVEKKGAEVVDNDFFIKRVPILSHTSPFAGAFPRYNRIQGDQPSAQALKRVLEPLGRNPSDAALAKALADFQVLIYLTELFDSEEDITSIARSVASHVVPGQEPVPIQEGYKLLMFSMAGIEN
ncbi:Nuclear protein localization protein 4-like [Hondaea fermentalgiana]|uniref:Nuclear protein localization protein 4-like n=1 Tax=Hondaea fermentalgiana TaxID=2315210 RepID=A0A2R5GLH7_9STRA|nr:Nuclear protein localization protein 4-like [Hondaea fermentalgiana]|eukprot:GBG31730.1 Nuclear protein localization protein 4-like [Hondaea fermentalgiana]